jgi:hypothetical protein
LKVSFDNHNLRISSKKFNPFNFSVYGINVRTVKKENETDPLIILQNLASAKGTKRSGETIENAKVMRKMLE